MDQGLSCSEIRGPLCCGASSERSWIGETQINNGSGMLFPHLDSCSRDGGVILIYMCVCIYMGSVFMYHISISSLKSIGLKRSDLYSEKLPNAELLQFT